MNSTEQNAKSNVQKDSPFSKVGTAEQKRLISAREEGVPWKKWGPYLSERQWGTVREDYSEGGDAWDYFPHDHARSPRLPMGRGRAARHNRSRAAALLRARAVERPGSHSQGASLRADQSARATTART